MLIALIRFKMDSLLRTNVSEVALKVGVNRVNKINRNNALFFIRDYGQFWGHQPIYFLTREIGEEEHLTEDNSKQEGAIWQINTYI